MNMQYALTEVVLSDELGDLNLDEVFADTSTPTTVVKAEAPPAAPVATTPEEPLIKTKTGTVYKSKEDAIAGIEHKDSLIAELRKQVQQATGSDPLKPKREEPRPVSYIEEQEKYFEDIADAVSKKDTAAYMKAQQKLIWDTLGPMAPTIVALARSNAERVVSEQLPEFKGFLQSDEFAALSTEMPLLADAIRQSESNPAAAQQLPELYKVAYLAVQGRKVPELVRSTAVQPQTQTRPTVHSSPLPAAPTSGVVTTVPDLTSKEGRKALIDQAERSGIQNLKW